MKRTKEAYFRPHPDAPQTEGCSGLKEFEGEDLSYEARIKYQKEQQKIWIEQQIQEKKWKEEQERLEEQAYAQQTLELNRMRGMLEDQYNKKRAQIRDQMKETNLQFSKSKKDSEDQQKNDKLNYEKQEVSTTQIRGQKKAFP